LKEEDYEAAEFNINTIVHVGAFGAALGFLGTVSGGYNALMAIRHAAQISMPVIFEGINIALSSTLLGLQLFVFSAIVWFVLKNILVRMKK
jgi:biopolymer transport protein ExbB/TolQ